MGEALRGLRSVKAPWDFQARLQQRLAKEKSAAGISRRWISIPAWGVAAVVFAAAGITLYVALEKSGQAARDRAIIDSVIQRGGTALEPIPARPPSTSLPPLEVEFSTGPRGGVPVSGAEGRKTFSDTLTSDSLASARSKPDSTDR